MNILLPLFPTNAIEKALLPETLRRAPFLRDLAALGGPPPTWRVLAVAADQALLDIVAPFGAQCRLLDVEPGADGCGLLPPGARRALELLQAGQPGEPGQPAADALWCVLDLGVPEPDAPGLESVEKACELYERETPVAVASVVVVDDHPAQLDAYYRLLDVELLVFLHSAGGQSAHGRPDGWVQSAPFFLEWEAFEADAPLVEGQAYALEPGVDSWHVRLETRPPEEADVSGEPGEFGEPWEPWEPGEPGEFGGAVRFCPAGPGLARRLAAARELRVEAGRSACAAPCFKALGASSCLLLRESATEVGLYIREQPGADTPRVRAWPIGGLRLLPVPPLESDGEADCSGLRTVRMGAAAYTGPVLRFAPPEGAEALAVAVLERASGQDVDFMEPLESPPLPEPFWHVDKATKLRSNARTGRTITGRQDFCELYEFDRALCLFRARDAAGLDAAARQGAVAGLVLSTGESAAPGGRKNGPGA